MARGGDRGFRCILLMDPVQLLQRLLDLLTLGRFARDDLAPISLELLLLDFEQLTQRSTPQEVSYDSDRELDIPSTSHYKLNDQFHRRSARAETKT